MIKSKRFVSSGGERIQCYKIGSNNGGGFSDYRLDVGTSWLFGQPVFLLFIRSGVGVSGRRAASPNTARLFGIDFYRVPTFYASKDPPGVLCFSDFKNKVAVT